MTRVLTFGTFDVFHIGHVNMLVRAADLGDHLTVGVSSDNLNFSKKQRYPVYREEHRVSIIKSLACVDEVFVEESLELKGEYIQRFGADILVMGDDWAGKFDHYRELCEVVYLPRTADVSTTDIIQDIKERQD
ncbi:adenylyltransferase/cytidyltransferase family protein [Demequina flava]|uniref:adenylyltransferase/cytidyltransferase family protein n=1 Tax=Demequina flava TaxID=1095025 RepID=UPI0007859943|nr:adenylyltransferase/cytidyltransferase family protein [Demequina flava]